MMPVISGLIAASVIRKLLTTAAVLLVTLKLVVVAVYLTRASFDNDFRRFRPPSGFSFLGPTVLERAAR